MIKDRLKIKLKKFDKTIVYLAKRLGRTKDEMIEILSEPKWFEKFYFYNFNLHNVYKNNPTIWQDLHHYKVKVPFKLKLKIIKEPINDLQN